MLGINTSCLSAEIPSKNLNFQLTFSEKCQEKLPKEDMINKEKSPDNYWVDF